MTAGDGPVRGEDLKLTLRVMFSIDGEAALARLREKAREVDVEIAGWDPEDLPATYTPAQALQVVLHGAPEFLFGPAAPRMLNGWGVVDRVWEEGETPAP